MTDAKQPILKAEAGDAQIEASVKPLCGERGIFPTWTGVSNVWCGMQANHHSHHRFWVEWSVEAKSQNDIDSIVPTAEQYCQIPSDSQASSVLHEW